MRKYIVLMLLVGFVGLWVTERAAWADPDDDLRARVAEALQQHRRDQVDNAFREAMREASRDNQSERLGRIELLYAEIDAGKPSASSVDRAHKAMLHLGTQPEAKQAAVRWRVSGAQVALEEGRLGAAALHVQEGRAALKALASSPGGDQAAAQGKQGGVPADVGAALIEGRPLDFSRGNVTVDTTRLDETERALLARLQEVVEQHHGSTAGLPPGTLAALSAYALRKPLVAAGDSDEPAAAKSVAAAGLLGKLRQALSAAEEREIAEAAACGDEDAAAAGRRRHADTLLSLHQLKPATDAATAAREQYRKQGALDKVVELDRWFIERAGGNPRAVLEGRRELVDDVERHLAGLVGQKRSALRARYRSDYLALLDATMALSQKGAKLDAAEALAPLELLRGRSVWEHAELLGSAERWKNVGDAAAGLRKTLESVARDDLRHAPDDMLALVEDPNAPSVRAKQQVYEALAGRTPSPPLVATVDDKALAAKLGGRTLFVYARLDDQRLAIGAVGGKAQAPMVKVVSLSAADESAMLSSLRSALTEDGDGWHDPARRLYDAVVAPVERALGAGAVIVPDGALAAAPFAVFEDRKGQLLGQRVTLSFMPSLQAVAAPKPERSKATDSMVLGVPRFSEPGMATLPAADKEAATVKAALAAAGRQPRPLSAANAARQLATDAGSYDVIHLATRVRLDADAPLLGSVLFAAGQLFGFDLGALPLRANLFVLDAAVAPQAGASEGSLTPGALARGLAGLAAGALVGPARSVVLALAGEPGPSSSALLARFYERYLGGESPATALAGAQRDMASDKLGQPLLLQAGANPLSDGPRFVHPRYWAQFALWGEP